MLKSDYQTSDYYAHKNCVGLIVLQSDEVIEEEVRAWLPDDTRLFHTRIESGADVTAESLLEMREKIPLATAMFPASAPFDVIAYGCTSGTTLIGEDIVEQKVKQILPKVKVTNPLTAVKANFKHLKAARIGMLTPYLPSVTAELSQHLHKHGFNIVAAASFHEQTEANVCRIAEQSIIDALRYIAVEADCDALFASCTNLRTYSLLDSLSSELGLPVISSNSALAWHINELSN